MGHKDKIRENHISSYLQHFTVCLPRYIEKFDMALNIRPSVIRCVCGLSESWWPEYSLYMCSDPATKSYTSQMGQSIGEVYNFMAGIFDPRSDIVLKYNIIFLARPCLARPLNNAVFLADRSRHQKMCWPGFDVHVWVLVFRLLCSLLSLCRSEMLRRKNFYVRISRPLREWDSPSAKCITSPLDQNICIVLQCSPPRSIFHTE